ncbi:hypothetical protein J1N35_023517 [Gossypium stocksii]|uniref:Uncharacterized protein n=1 Tax=Gossypium stocksii TaxID=47602 RepID=A0A9D3VIX8_9ROSI|nr:hypothetical protein J1N35_023517 [Gossypium stocksii]
MLHSLGLADDEFNESKSEEEPSDFDRFDCAIGDDVFNNVRINVCGRGRVNLDGLNMDDLQLGELSDNDKSETLNSAYELDSNDKTWPEFNIETNMNNSKLEIRLLFPNKDSLKEIVRKYGKVSN